MSNWFSRNIEGVVIGIMVLLVVVLVAGNVADAKRRQTACSQMWAASRTSADTLATIRFCAERERGPAVVPVVIPVR